MTDEKGRILQAKISVENKLEHAEEKLIEGVIDDQSFERLKKTYREQIGNFENQIATLDGTVRTSKSMSFSMSLLSRVISVPHTAMPSRNSNSFISDYSGITLKPKKERFVQQ